MFKIILMDCTQCANCKFMFQYPVTLVNVFASTDTVTTIDDMVFSWQSVPQLYNKAQLDKP
jgi:hypothetical protein